MDHFGIGTTIASMLSLYSTAARRTGRTTSLVESLKNSDRVVCATPQEAARLKLLCRERGINVECIVVDPSQPWSLFERPPSEGRTVLDHTWVEAYYRRVIERAVEHLDTLQREASGFGEAHRASRRAAELFWRRPGT